jgi:hypothetical protein
LPPSLAEELEMPLSRSVLFLAGGLGTAVVALGISLVGCGSSSSGAVSGGDSGKDSNGPGDSSPDRADGSSGGDGSPSRGDGGDGGDTGPAGDGACNGSVALTYNAATDRLPHMATPPTLGPAGSIVKDPTYGTKLVRITDTTTMEEGSSYTVANEFWGNDWNTDATLFYFQDATGTGGGHYVYTFDPITLAAAPVAAKAGGTLKMPLASGGFSRTDPNILYGYSGSTIAEFDFTTQTTTDIVAIDTIAPGLSGSLGVQVGQNGLLATAIGGAQDVCPDLATWDPTTKTGHVVSVANSTLDGKPLGTTIGGGVHVFHLDASGQYLAFEVASGSSSFWVWNTSTNTVTTLPSLDTVGAGAWVAKVSGQSYAWNLQTFADPTKSVSLIHPAMTSSSSASLEWKNATAGASAPLIVETMRPPADTSPWGAWDDEILAVRTDGVTIPGDGGPETEVWRFAHTFNTYTGPTASDNYYYLFIPRVSQNGWFVLYDSNWNSSLGTATGGTPRTDVFVAALPTPCGP